MKLYIIAGETSGDFIGGQLIESLHKLSPDKHLEIQGVGGVHMQNKGVESLFPLNQINLMGFLEVLPHLLRIKKLINKTVQHIVTYNPDILITIDSPGFTFRVAKKVRAIAPHIKLVHIVAPSVWVYKPGRAKKYANLYDCLLTLLPFEPPYFTKHGLDTICIGHPVLEQNFKFNSQILKKDFALDKNVKIIAVTPGSRPGEIERHMPVITEVCNNLSLDYNIKIIFVQTDKTYVNKISDYLDEAKFQFMFSTDRIKAFAVSDCVLAKSGTNTLEIAATGTPMLIGYKLNMLTFYILKMIIRIKYACLINIIADKEIIPEYIQLNFNANKITPQLKLLLDQGNRGNPQVLESRKILQSIGFNSQAKPSEIAAKKILNLIQ
ncbi:MAG: lipid-A-disaccharide synthase [Rickettsiaceae bacterium]